MYIILLYIFRSSHIFRHRGPSNAIGNIMYCKGSTMRKVSISMPWHRNGSCFLLYFDLVKFDFTHSREGYFTAAVLISAREATLKNMCKWFTWTMMKPKQNNTQWIRVHISWSILFMYVWSHKVSVGACRILLYKPEPLQIASCFVSRSAWLSRILDRLHWRSSRGFEDTMVVSISIFNLKLVLGFFWVPFPFLPTDAQDNCQWERLLHM